MADNGFITPDEAEKALLTGIELAPYSPYTQVQEPYVVAYVRKQLIDMFGEEKVFEGGLEGADNEGQADEGEGDHDAETGVGGFDAQGVEPAADRPEGRQF